MANSMFILQYQVDIIVTEAPEFGLTQNIDKTKVMTAFHSLSYNNPSINNVIIEEAIVYNKLSSDTLLKLLIHNTSNLALWGKI
ncbi:unnamed protein product [Gordionus sp. m RMFG-2023]